MSWNNATSKVNQYSEGSNLFLRLVNDGDTAVGAFCGEPFVREVVWTGERYEEYDPEVHTKKASLRIAINFFVAEEEEMKVYEGGVRWFKDVLKLRKKYGLDDWLFEMERRGEAGDPKTTYSILPEKQLTPEQKERIAALGLHDLEPLLSEKPVEKNPDEEPLAKNVVQEFIGHLKTLPREDVDRFLRQFQVKRVRDLKAFQEKPARMFLGSFLVRDQGPGEEIDPFA